MVESSGTVPPCPHCGGKLHYRDTKRRIRRKEGGIVEWLRIRRFHCEECHAYHNELPSCLLPYKHYDAEVISGVIEDQITSDDQDSEDYPCAMTMHRWKQWYKANHDNIEGYLKKAQSLLEHTDELHLAAVSLLRLLRDAYPDWLERAIRTVYNSGGFLPAVPL